jgi:uncharacterized protein YbjT (DUF2867 family)
VKTAIIAGPTGLIGSQLLSLILKDDRYHQVKVLTRSSLRHDHAKMQNLVIDFDRLPTYADQMKADDVFCCLGTTMRKAKSRVAFRKVDFSYPLELANLTRQHGAHQYLLVSALGANKHSSIFYNRVKGEVEEAIGQLGFETFHVFRPSLLLGPRKEARPGEDAAKWFYKFFGFLIPNKYKAIDSVKVAKAMLHYANVNQPGRFIHDSQDLQRF